MGQLVDRQIHSRVRRAIVVAVTAALAMPVFGLASGIERAAAVAGTPTPVYDAIGANPPGNVPSVGFAATSTAEFGDAVRLAAGPRVLDSVTVLMSSWACETGTWNAGDCASASGAAFTHPLTLNVYAVSGPDSAPVPGALLATTTKTATIPFRPSADATNCTGGNAGKWFDPTDGVSGTCYNGFATPVTFTFPGATLLPTRVIWTVAFNTTSSGAAPIGAQPCSATPAGCPYDSLNVGASTLSPVPVTGTDVDVDDVVQSSTWTGAYCDDGAAGTGTLRNDSGCWTGVGSSRVDLQACKLEYSIVSPK